VAEQLVRALTIRQPWAGAIFHGKDVENRPFSYRGILLVHAGQQLADATAFSTLPRLGVEIPVLGSPLTPAEWALGAVVGVVEVVSSHRSRQCVPPCSPWAMANGFHLRLANARLLRKPVPAYGKQGLWAPSDELLGDVRKQVSW